MNRREFLKGLGTALLGVIAPKKEEYFYEQPAEEDPLEWRWVDDVPEEEVLPFWEHSSAGFPSAASMIPDYGPREWEGDEPGARAFSAGYSVGDDYLDDTWSFNLDPVYPTYNPAIDDLPEGTWDVTLSMPTPAGSGVFPAGQDAWSYPRPSPGADVEPYYLPETIHWQACSVCNSTWWLLSSEKRIVCTNCGAEYDPLAG